VGRRGSGDGSVILSLTIYLDHHGRFGTHYDYEDYGYGAQRFRATVHTAQYLDYGFYVLTSEHGGIVFEQKLLNFNPSSPA